MEKELEYLRFVYSQIPRDEVLNGINQNFRNGYGHLPPGYSEKFGEEMED